MPKCPRASRKVIASCTESEVTSPPFPALRDTEEIKGEYLWRGILPQEALALPLPIASRISRDCSSTARLAQLQTAKPVLTNAGFSETWPGYSSQRGALSPSSARTSRVGQCCPRFCNPEGSCCWWKSFSGLRCRAPASWQNHQRSMEQYWGWKFQKFLCIMH